MHDSYKIVEKGNMNSHGKLVDVTGNPLAVGNQVKVVEGYECCTTPRHDIGTVMVLHESGDWVGYASVRWRDGGVSCSVPDKALKIVARKATGIDPKELQAFAIYLRKEWDLRRYPDDEAVARAVAEYVVARVEATTDGGVT